MRSQLVEHLSDALVLDVDDLQLDVVLRVNVVNRVGNLVEVINFALDNGHAVFLLRRQPFQNVEVDALRFVNVHRENIQRVLCNFSETDLVNLCIITVMDSLLELIAELTILQLDQLQVVLLAGRRIHSPITEPLDALFFGHFQQEDALWLEAHGDHLIDLVLRSRVAFKHPTVHLAIRLLHSVFHK